MAEQAGPTHTIRLCGPWQAVTSGSSQKVTLPGTLPPEIASGGETVRLQRKFNCPTGLEGQRVRVVLESASVSVRITLNGHDLAQAASEHLPQACEITSLLEPHNEVVLELELPAEAKAPLELGLVKLEIGP